MWLDPVSGIRDPGSGIEKKSGSAIWDKHPGSATLVGTHRHLLVRKKELNQYRYYTKTGTR